MHGAEELQQPAFTRACTTCPAATAGFTGCPMESLRSSRIQHQLDRFQKVQRHVWHHAIEVVDEHADALTLRAFRE
jgi:hypothetical protein